MKYPVLMTAITVGLIGITSAQAKPMHDKGEMFTALDADNNGELSQQELSNMRETMAKMRFDAADTNSDGQIDKDEFMAKAEKRAERMFKHRDKDENGTLDASEAQSSHHGKRHDKKGHGDHDNKDKGEDRAHAQGKRHGKMLERMDSDGNGSVSKAEWDSAMQRHQERREDKSDAQ